MSLASSTVKSVAARSQQSAAFFRSGVGKRVAIRKWEFMQNKPLSSIHPTDAKIGDKGTISLVDQVSSLSELNKELICSTEALQRTSTPHQVFSKEWLEQESMLSEVMASLEAHGLQCLKQRKAIVFS